MIPLPKCGYEITWDTGGEDFSRICEDRASLKCVTCETYFCSNHNLLSDCIECEKTNRCIDCPEMCKQCSDKSEECSICQSHRPCEFYCEDCLNSNCGKCLDEGWSGLECDGCGKLACCTPLEKIEKFKYYCNKCLIIHTE